MAPRVVPDHIEVKRIKALLEEWIRRFPARLPGTPGCEEAGEAIEEAFRRAGVKAWRESFVCSPDAFMGYHVYVFLLYAVGVVFLAYGWSLAAGPCFLAALAMDLGEFVLFLPVVDRLFPRKVCRNVIAEIPAAKEEHLVVYVCAHHDAARELPYLKRRQVLYPLKVLGGEAFTLGAALCALGVGLGWWTLGPGWVVFFVLGIPFLFQRATFVFRHGVPGAGDNLVACAMLVELARLYARRPPQYLTLRLVSFDAEESGLRGSAAFVRRHRDELRGKAAVVLNIDSIYRREDLQILVSDINGLLPLSGELASAVARWAEEEGVGLPVRRMTFGGGGTDAASFARAGIPAVSFIGIANRMIRRRLVYHTMADLPPAVEDEAVRDLMRVLLVGLRRLDEEGYAVYKEGETVPKGGRDEGATRDRRGGVRG
ncbi:M28 family metallopeptidase [Spirochaeta thermophila]|uniref:Putative aminopeptidase n=1 Tax=Winmispira thermophila (strain ATCC 49972 / DSM 6192 / RI 19.B1) TaxID=665571 RepID=E0RPG1_WINT6|nr:M20/M25/M40 family metallo-hydrolase [Spirochaeta thermophila]ADN02743.1 putative aminopeptidase [Spirochaeta thermophila DSM 6192]